jgi:hypothetical protein
VSVKPVLDLTKISLAGLTAWGAVALMAVKTMKKR